MKTQRIHHSCDSSDSWSPLEISKIFFNDYCLANSAVLTYSSQEQLKRLATRALVQCDSTEANTAELLRASEFDHSGGRTRAIVLTYGRKASATSARQTLGRASEVALARTLEELGCGEHFAMRGEMSSGGETPDADNSIRLYLSVVLGTESLQPRSRVSFFERKASD